MSEYRGTRGALQLIVDVAAGFDGQSDVDGLMALINEISNIAMAALSAGEQYEVGGLTDEIMIKYVTEKLADTTDQETRKKLQAYLEKLKQAASEPYMQASMGWDCIHCGKRFLIGYKNENGMFCKGCGEKLPGREEIVW